MFYSPDTEDQLKVIDFGLSKIFAIQEDHDVSAMTTAPKGRREKRVNM